VTAVLHCGDVRQVLAGLPERSVQCVVTSPPYWGLRDYGHGDQLGLERTPEEYVANMVAVFREVRRVLRDDGVLWLNLGDSYAAHPGQRKETDKAGAKQMTKRGSTGSPSRHVEGLKPKDLVGIPWMVAFALRSDGWYLRSDIIWAKPNPMPESVTDRPTKAHEYLFLLTKSERYHYDAAAIAEPVSEATTERVQYPRPRERDNHIGRLGRDNTRSGDLNSYNPTRNARTVWTIATQPYAGAHFATFPEELARRCILAGSKPEGAVLDPFGGSGTVAAVATGHGRRAIYIDLNPAYLDLAEQRIGPFLCSRAQTEKDAA
jgi:DNA modification methylase